MIISGYTVYQMLFLELKATERKKKTKLLINKCNPFFSPQPRHIFSWTLNQVLNIIKAKQPSCNSMKKRWKCWSNFLPASFKPGGFRGQLW